MDERAQKLRRAVTRYRREQKRADDIKAKASDELKQAIREAYADGMKKADILRGIDHEWSRTWVDHAVGGVKKAAEQ
ncbi:hypothetical protein Drose_05545 [Dactylosporangium roseum]|uniref:Uncharacterized protein n=1 Tax=Dactylosporangium roseum TaxID=47989 RepID=A0ABY5Z6Q8_9ACTN|nr:hypothetical protein [Dactylosporangium roseum]UWZ37733.1 hypothetical protein Drose_05545 [Dactylosporangium roseum]